MVEDDIWFGRLMQNNDENGLQTYTYEGLKKSSYAGRKEYLKYIWRQRFQAAKELRDKSSSIISVLRTQHSCGKVFTEGCEICNRLDLELQTYSQMSNRMRMIRERLEENRLIVSRTMRVLRKCRYCDKTYGSSAMRGKHMKKRHAELLERDAQQTQQNEVQE